MKILILLCSLVTLPLFAKLHSYSIAGKTYEGYVINKGKSAPLVFIIHDWDGVSEYEIKRAQMLEKLGYSVFAADLYGKGNRPTDVNSKKAMTKSLYDDRAKMLELMNGALKEARTIGLNTKKVVALGYCFGGTAILELARSGLNLNGYASFHGGLETPKDQSYKDIKSKIVIFHGTADTSVTMDHFAGLAKELEQNNVPHEMITYSGAPHAFSVFGGERYREDADKKSWRRFVEFLKEQF